MDLEELNSKNLLITTDLEDKVNFLIKGRISETFYSKLFNILSRDYVEVIEASVKDNEVLMEFNVEKSCVEIIINELNILGFE